MNNYLFLFSFLPSILSFCQTQSIAVDYFETSIISSFEPQVYKLCITENSSHYSYIHNLEQEEELGNKKQNVVFDDIGGDIDYSLILKDYSKIQILCSYLGIGEKSFLVKDSLNLMRWTLTDEKKEILGMQCKSAEVSFRGRDYKAFYTEAIPIPEGPWKFYGLPGLILYIKSRDQFYEAKAAKINHQTDLCNKIPYDYYEKIVSKYKFLNGWSEFKSEYIKATNKHIKYVRSSFKTTEGSTFNYQYRSSIEAIYPEMEKPGGIQVW